jgi:glycosyltransferase involved in cell wall biosynthesis
MHGKQEPTLSRISVITPVYNMGVLIGDLAESLRRQQYENLEWLVVDDGSDEETRVILQQLEQQIPWMRLILLGGNQGACVARNHGLKEATGDWVKFVDADDYLSDNMLRVQAEVAAKENVDIVISPTAMVKNRIWDNATPVAKPLPDDVASIFSCMQGFRFHHTGCLFRKSLIEEVGGWKKGLKAGQDTDLLFRIWKTHPRVRVVNECVFCHLNHSLTERITGSMTWGKLLSQMEVREYMLSSPGDLDIDLLRKFVAGNLNQYAYKTLDNREFFAEVERVHRKLLGAPWKYGFLWERPFKFLLGYRRHLMIKRWLLGVKRRFRR